MNINFIKIVDKILGSLLCFTLSFLNTKKEIDTKKSHKILFIQLWGIGETILTLPAIESIRKKYKDSEIYVACTDRNKEVYLNEDINILTLQLSLLSIIRFVYHNLRKFDIVIDMEEYLNISAIISFFIGKQRIGFAHNIRGRLFNSTVFYDDKKHMTDTFLDLAKKIEGNEQKLKKLQYSTASKKKIKKVLPKTKKIGIVAGAAESARSRMWPEKKFIDLCNVLSKKYKLVFMGAPHEKEKNRSIIRKIKNKKNIIDTTGKLSLEELFALIDNLDILITNDTGPLHIASAQKTKTIALFGPNTPIRFGPYHKNSIAIYHPERCRYSPCINVHKGEVPDCLYPKYSKDYQKCMKAISVKQVKKAADKLLS